MQMVKTVSIAKDNNALKKAYAIRRQVFIEEQNVPEKLEMDAYDEAPSTQHFLLCAQDGCALGTARVRPYDAHTAKVERVAVLAEARGTGGGRMLMEAVQNAAEKAGCRRLKLAAQVHARKFYEQLGFEAQGDTYYEAGILHIDMVKDIGNK